MLHSSLSSPPTPTSNMQKKTGGTLALIYLTSYNTFQSLLWAYIIYLSITAYPQTPLWTTAPKPTLLAVGLSWIETLHAATGLVKGTPSSAAVQAFGRTHALLIPYTFTLAQQNEIGLLSLFLVWGISEIIRYPWYTLTTLQICPYPLTWLRYSAFIILYPIGILSELSGYYAAWPQIQTFTGYDLVVHGFVVFRFKYWVVFGIIVLYPLAGPFLYFHMLKQRNKKLKSKIM